MEGKPFCSLFPEAFLFFFFKKFDNSSTVFEQGYTAARYSVV